MAAANNNTVTTNIFQVLPTKGFPFSYNEVQKAEMRGPMQGMMIQEALRDVVWFTDDFTGKAISSTVQWAVANGGGASVSSFATNVQANGIVRATTGTANGVTASASLIGPIIYQPSTNMGIEFRYKIVTANTSIRMEMGFIDAVPGSNTAGFNNMDTPTAFAANAITAGIDTSATANNINLFTVGNAASQAVHVQAGGVGLPAVGTYQTIRLQVYSLDSFTNHACGATLWVDGNVQATYNPSAGVADSQVLLGPWVYFEAINATSKSIDLDYVTIWSQRIT